MVGLGFDALLFAFGQTFVGICAGGLCHEACQPTGRFSQKQTHQEKDESSLQHLS
jgi:hypothetical protein